MKSVTVSGQTHYGFSRRLGSIDENDTHEVYADLGYAGAVPGVSRSDDGRDLVINVKALPEEMETLVIRAME